MIYFVRHGETDYNLKGITQGQLDIPLNQTGIEQARKVAQKLKNYKIDMIYCSPLVRAKKTAEIINEFHGVEIVFDNRLKEFYAGAKQGTIDLNWDKKHKAEYLHEPEKYNAEPYQKFYDRVVDVLKEIRDLNKNVLIVSHGGVYRNIYRYKNNIKDFTQQFYTLRNCEIVEFD